MANVGIGAGTVLKRNGAAVAGVKDLEGPGLKVTSVQNTPLAVADFTHTKQPGMIDAGQLKGKLFTDKSVLNTLYTTMGNRTTDTWSVTLPDNSIWSASGFIIEIGNEYPLDDMIMFDMTVELSTKPTFTPG